MTALPSLPMRHDWAALPMRTAMATFWPPTEDRLRFMKQLGIDDTILWATTFPTPDAASFKELLAVLDPDEFWQVHRSVIVRTAAIHSVRRQDDGKWQLRLKGHGEELPVSNVFQHLFRGM